MTIKKKNYVDTKGVFRRHKLKKGRQYSGQKKRDEKQNNAYKNWRFGNTNPTKNRGL